MKAAVALLIASATASLAAAQPHRHAHAHAHLHKKDVEIAKRDTIVVWELNGSPISADEVKQGIANGTLKYDGDGNPFYASQPSSSSSAAATMSSSSASRPYAKPSWSSSAAASAPTQDVQKVKATSAASSSAASSSAVASSAAASSSAAATSAAASSSSVSQSSSNQGGTGIDAVFPDGTVDCSDFPDQYGALSVDWMNLGGWTSIQNPGDVSGSGFANILTVTKAQCNGAQCCTEGSYCSYACPAGYLKFQWPATQGATGQSVGGLLCKGGKLHRTNSDSQQLCKIGTDKVKVKIQNKLKGNVALCRTEYPGSENMVIPLNIDSGSTKPVACPDGANFYHWQGARTSAQYYLNREGYSTEKACQWGNQGDDFGNFAPMVLGVGYTSGAAWLSIQNNMPTQSASQNYDVYIKGDTDFCKYSNGQYCNNGGCNSNGCTVSVTSGEVTYVVG